MRAPISESLIERGNTRFYVSHAGGEEDSAFHGDGFTSLGDERNAVKRETHQCFVENVEKGQEKNES